MGRAFLPGMSVGQTRIKNPILHLGHGPWLPTDLNEGSSLPCELQEVAGRNSVVSVSLHNADTAAQFGGRCAQIRFVFLARWQDNVAVACGKIGI